MSNAEEGQTTSSVETPSEAPAEQLPTPGALLGAQRETLEYSLQQVADRLNLTMHFVRSIESDSYEKLPGDVFIRGYLRSYSELLQLDPEYVLELYNHFTQRRQARKQEAIKRISRRRKDKNRPWIVVSGIAFVLLALILWYFNQPEETQSVRQNPTLPVDTEITSGDPAQQIRLIEDVPLSSLDSESDPAPGIDPETASVSIPPSTDRGASNSSEAAPSAPGVSEEEVGVSAGSQPALPVSLEENPVVEILETQSLQWPGDDMLDIRFAEASWVEVSHDSGPESHEAMAQRGLRLLVNGQGPFTLELGNAEAVTVIYNERTLAFKNAIRDDGSVRLSVGI